MNALQFCELIHIICTLLVNTPEELKVSYENRDEDFLFTIHTKEGEQGQILGKNGKLIASLRLLIRAISRNADSPRIFIEVINNVTANADNCETSE